jgi:hypothetical protein
VFALVFAFVAGTACNAIFGNEPGHLVGEAGAGYGGDDGVVESGDALPASDADAEGEAGNDADAGDAEADGSAPDAWTPASLGSGLVLWLDGDRDVSTMSCGQAACVTRWFDQSSAHNDAIVELETASPPMRTPALYRGHAALRFDGSSTSLTVPDAPSLQIQNAWVILVVAAQQRAFHQGAFYSKTALAGPYAGLAFWGSYVSQYPHGAPAVQVDIGQFVVWPTGGFDDGKLHVFLANFDGESLSLIVDRQAPTSVTVNASSAVAAPGVPAYIGGNPGSGQVFIGDIAEIILATRSLDAGEWSMVYAYLAAKYAL